MTCAPRTYSSPTSPGPSTLPSSSSTQASVPGIATPAEVGCVSIAPGGMQQIR